MEKTLKIQQPSEEAIYLVDKTSKAPIPLQSIHIAANVTTSVASFVMT